MENYSKWPINYKEAISTLKDNYHQIDNDPNKTIKEKKPFLLDILKNAFQIMEQSNLKRIDFKAMVEESFIELR